MHEFICIFNTLSGTVDLDWSNEWQLQRAMKTAVDLAALARLGKALPQRFVLLLSSHRVGSRL
jgi:hypothetical protein